VKEFNENEYLVMATRKGIIKKTALPEYDSSRKTGIIAITLADDDELIDVKFTDGTQNIVMGTKNGFAITFHEQDARPIGRASRGVKGIKLSGDDELVGMDISEEGKFILTVTENGYGKLTKTGLYPVQNRAGKGVQNYKLTKKTGDVVGLCCIDKDENDVMLISNDGTVIRMDAAGISTMGRSTSGVTLMRLGEEFKVAAIAKVNSADEEDEEDLTLLNGGE
jgi:DNA gyrase subunit A